MYKSDTYWPHKVAMKMSSEKVSKTATAKQPPLGTYQFPTTYGLFPILLNIQGLAQTSQLITKCSKTILIFLLSEYSLSKCVLYLLDLEVLSRDSRLLTGRFSSGVSINMVTG